MRSSLLVLSLALLALAVSIRVPASFAAATTSQNNRIFYPSPPHALSTAPSSTSANFTFIGAPISFSYGLLSGPLTVSGPVVFSLWMDWEGKNFSMSPILTDTFDYKLPGGSWNNGTSNSATIQHGLKFQNVTCSIGSAIPLTISTQLALEINVTSIPKSSNVTLAYGARPISSQVPSHVGLVLSGYASMPLTNPVLVLNHQQLQTSTFNLTPGPGNNLVLIEASAYSAFGLTDISLNLTILDPNARPVLRETNVSMIPNPTVTFQPYEFFATWEYPSNSTQGTYQILISIIDSQNNIAYTLPTPASFALVPPGYVPFPYNLIPYLIVGGVGASGGVAGAVVYRRRRSRSYLVPFDYFNTLTGGELSGGTNVTVEGNTGSGKTFLLEQLMAEDLRKSRPCVFVTTGDFPDSVRSNMKSMGIDVSGYEQRGLLTFVDGYSAEAGQESKEKFSIPSLGDLTTFGIKLTSAFPTPSFKGGSLYFDSLTPLASKTRPEGIVSLVQSVGAKVKGLGGKAFFAVGLGIDPSVQRQLEDTTDCIVQMEAFEESGTRKRRLRIAKFRVRKHQDSWALFTIEEGKGIIFYAKRPRQ